MQQSATQSTAASEGAHDFGCLGRQAILFLAGSGVLWFIDGLLLTLVASIQAYMPGFMEGCPSLHYGRVRPAAHMAVIYGFLAQVGLAFVLWLFARQGKAVVRGVGAILIGTILWNIGVTYGVANVLLAGGTGFQWLEFPLGASRLMMIGYLLIAVPALMTYRSRSVWATEPQQWFALVALLALPWLYISANILLVFQPVRGVVQLTTSAWFVAGLSNLWLTPLGLSAILTILGNAAGAPVANRSMLQFAFWTLIIAGAWTGLPPGAPVPGWISGASGAFALALVIPVIYVSLAVLPILTSGRLELFGAGGFAFAALKGFGWALMLTAAVSFPSVHSLVGFTPFMDAIQVSLLFGLGAMALFGALYRVLPDILGAPLAKPGWVKLHFLAGAAGLSIWVIALVVGGMAQGMELSDPAKPFLSAIAAGRPFLMLATAGCGLFLLGFALFGFNFALQLLSIRERWCPCALLTESAPAQEVRS